MDLWWCKVNEWVKEAMEVDRLNGASGGWLWTKGVGRIA